jgi:hypothetical protein
VRVLYTFKAQGERPEDTSKNEQALRRFVAFAHFVSFDHDS